jgi:DNA-binding response OmpR family regulator
LLVDDEKDIVTVLSAGLRRKGFDVDGYSDPRQALDAFKPGRYDLAVLDFKMPGLGGYELASELTRLDRNIIVGFMSAFDIVPQDGKDQFRPLFMLRKPLTIQRMAEELSLFVPRQ